MKGRCAGSDGFDIAEVDVARVGTGVAGARIAGVEIGLGSVFIDTETAVMLALVDILAKS